MGLRLDVVGEVLIGDEEYVFGVDRVDDLGGLGHEVHTAEDDYFGVTNLTGLAREFERIADKVGDLENFGALIVVRQDNGTPFALEAGDFGDGPGKIFAGFRRVAFFIKY